VGQQVTLVAPVNLGLGTRDHLEPAVQTGQRVVIRLIQLGSDPWPGLGKEHLDPLIVAGETVLGDQPLMDHRAFQPQISPQPRLDDRHERGNEQRLTAGPRRTRRRDRGSILGQIPTNRAPVAAALAADLGERGARSMQGAETTNVHPGLRIQDHEEVTLRVVYLAVDAPKGDPAQNEKGLNSPSDTSGRTENGI